MLRLSATNNVWLEVYRFQICAAQCAITKLCVVMPPVLLVLLAAQGPQDHGCQRHCAGPHPWQLTSLVEGSINISWQVCGTKHGKLSHTTVVFDFYTSQLRRYFQPSRSFQSKLLSESQSLSHCEAWQVFVRDYVTWTQLAGGDSLWHI